MTISHPTELHDRGFMILSPNTTPSYIIAIVIHYPKMIHRRDTHIIPK